MAKKTLDWCIKHDSTIELLLEKDFMVPKNGVDPDQAK